MKTIKILTLSALFLSLFSCKKDETAPPSTTSSISTATSGSGWVLDLDALLLNADTSACNVFIDGTEFMYTTSNEVGESGTTELGIELPYVHSGSIIKIEPLHFPYMISVCVYDGDPPLSNWGGNWMYSPLGQNQDTFTIMSDTTITLP